MGTILFHFGCILVSALLLCVMVIIRAKWFGFLGLALLFSISSALPYLGGVAFCAMLCAATGLLATAVVLAWLSRPQWKTSFLGTLARELIRHLMLKSGRDNLSNPLQPEASKPRVVPPNGFTVVGHVASGVALELLQHKKSPTGKVILQCHGGGVVCGLNNAHRKNAIQLCKHSGYIPVVTFEYRLAPQHTYPAANEDTIKIWDWLLNQGYTESDIAVVGDSAGGNLALSLCLMLKQEGRKLPAAVVGFSPYADFTQSGSSYAFNMYRDNMFGVWEDYLPLDKMPETKPLAYCGQTPLETPFLSPVFGDYTGFPPLLLAAGTWEMLLSDTLCIHYKAKVAGVDTTLLLYEGMFHAYQFAQRLLRESRDTWNKAGDFISHHLQ